MNWVQIILYENVKDDVFTQFSRGVQIRGEGSISARGFGPGGSISANEFGPGGPYLQANLDRGSKSARTPANYTIFARPQRN